MVFLRRFTASLSVYLVYVVRSELIYEVVQPVGEQKVCVTSPTVGRALFGIVIREVVIGELNGKTCVQVAEVLS